jgi:hypothetical protein
MEEYEAAMRELTESEGALWPWGLARAHGWLGNADEAFRYLEAKAQRNPAQLGGLATHPMFTKLHDDPRWEPFLRSVNQLPEQVAALDFDVQVPD